MMNLPKHRVSLVKPFQHTGVDFTGHLWVKNEEGEVVKMYILLSTCLNVCAVHTELVPDMSSHQFVHAFTCFTNVYGIPSHLHSDNAKSFIAGGEILQKALVSDKYRAKFNVLDIQVTTCQNSTVFCVDGCHLGVFDMHCKVLLI